MSCSRESGNREGEVSIVASIWESGGAMCCVSDLGVEVSPVGVERIQGHADKSRDNGLKANKGP